MKLIIGLGNPGLEYKGTKHNIGFAVVESLAKSNRIKIKERLHFSVAGKGVVGGQRAVLALPQTYMNLSGKAVGELMARSAAGIDDLLIVCDDINLELGKVRLRKQGSSGGHKGLESVIHTLKADNFARLRVGIATDVHRGDITNYVLSPFKRRQKRNAAHSVEMAAETVSCMMKEGIDNAMSRYNKRKAGTS